MSLCILQPGRTPKNEQLKNTLKVAFAIPCALLYTEENEILRDGSHAFEIVDALSMFHVDVIVVPSKTSSEKNGVYAHKYTI